MDPRRSVWARIAPVTAILAAIVLSSCTPAPQYVCTSNAQCVDEAGGQGICEPNGGCAFPDPTCPAPGLRFDDAAGTDSSTCVTAGNACIAQIALGVDFGCAVKDDGTVWCWGANDVGQLGDGTTTDRAEAKAVPGLSDVTAISAAELHVCALKKDSTVWCWGGDAAKQLGQCQPIDKSTTPVEVPSFTLSNGAATCDPSAPFKATALAAGGQHNCAIGADAQVYCWGENQKGSQGGQAGQPPSMFDDVPGPLVISGGFDGAVGVQAGDEYSCVLKDEHSVWCWGADNLDELGNGGGALSPSAVNVSGFSDASALVLDDETGCALTKDSSLWCWGSGSTGIFSPTDLTNRGTPQLVTNAAAVFSGSTSETLCLLSPDAQLQCWGANDKGQAGTGSTDPVVGAPTPIPLVTVKSASLSLHDVCALTLDGQLFCWGDGSRGQLGPGGPAVALTPVRVPFTCP